MTVTNDLATLAGADVISNNGFLRNRIINGAMQIWQRGTSFSPTGTSISSYYLVDRFFIESTNSTAVATWAQSTDAPNGFNYSVLQTVTTTQSSVASTGQYYGFCQQIEGYNFADLAYGTSGAKSATLSFWVKSSVTGTYSGAVMQIGTNTRSYPITYTISSASTWTFITIPITGDTVANAMSTTNGASVRVELYTLLSAGYANGTANQWNTNSASNSFASSTGVNLFATSGATWQITGVQLEAGTVATAFERRLYGQELALCQRYCYRLGANGTSTYNWLSSSGAFSSTTNGFASGSCPVVMRTTPSLVTDSSTLSNYAVYTPNGGAFNPLTSISFNAVTNPNNYLINFGIASGGTAGQVAYLCQNNQTTYGIYLQAEL